MQWNAIQEGIYELVLFGFAAAMPPQEGYRGSPPVQCSKQAETTAFLCGTSSFDSLEPESTSQRFLPKTTGEPRNQDVLLTIFTRNTI